MKMLCYTSSAALAASVCNLRCHRASVDKPFLAKTQDVNKCGRVWAEDDLSFSFGETLQERVVFLACSKVSVVVGKKV